VTRTLKTVFGSLRVTNARFDPTIPHSSVTCGSLPPRLACSLVRASLSPGTGTFWGNHGSLPRHWHQQPYLQYCCSRRSPRSGCWHSRLTSIGLIAFRAIKADQ
jgi:hypothetical protein